jgi:HEPN pEK499 p136
LGLAHRAMKNLEYIERSFDSGADVHVVTQILTSLQAILVLPYEVDCFDANEQQPISSYPEWIPKIDTYKKRPCNNLGTLLWHVRNAIAHRRLHFSSESRKPSEVVIRFSDEFTDRNTRQTQQWEMEIRGDLLREFGKILSRMLGGS